MNLGALQRLFADAGAIELYAKELSTNDNSKNQIYFAGAVEALNVFPSEKIFAENTRSGPSFKAKLNFAWLLENGTTASAPDAQLILYSQYPEVRFSGFLKGCKSGPGELMMDRGRASRTSATVRERLVDRVLFLGVTRDRRVLGHLVAGNSQIAGEFREARFPSAMVVFRRVPLPSIPSDDEATARLLAELRRIHHKGWIDSKQLDAAGVLKPCNAPQCGGFTLEAELQIPKNSSTDPDFLGWEIKQHAVSNFRNIEVGTITLMTPEPTGGFYKEHGVEAFVRRFGYADRRGREDRLNFGGVHRIGVRQSNTQLTLVLNGYDETNRKITDAGGSIALVTDAGTVAASWGFSGVLAHWSRKHTRAAYVASLTRKESTLQYCYAPIVRLARETDSLRLLAAFTTGDVYYDPGVKIERASSTKPAIKRRNQFRIASRSIDALYTSVTAVML